MKEENKNLKKLTWKYFWENKLIEVLAVIGFVLIPFFFGKVCSLIIPDTIYESIFEVNYIGTIGQQWLFGAVILFILAIIVAVIGAIIYSNWNWAEKRAEEKIEKSKKKSK